MDKHTNSMTALKPSFGMPAVGGAACATLACTGVVVSERVRPMTVIGTDAVAATTQRAFAGTPAWRPPSC